MTVPAQALTSEAARRLLVEHGPNALPEPAGVPLWRRIVRQFKSPLIYVLLFAVAFDVAAWIWVRGQGWPVEGLVIAAVLDLPGRHGSYEPRRSRR